LLGKQGGRIFPKIVKYQIHRGKSQWGRNDFSAADDLLKADLVPAAAGFIRAVLRMALADAGRIHAGAQTGFATVCMIPTCTRIIPVNAQPDFAGNFEPIHRAV